MVPKFEEFLRPMLLSYKYDYNKAAGINKYAKWYCINQKHEIERFQNS